jgi:sirohydrochlorin ferrochelatase
VSAGARSVALTMTYPAPPTLLAVAHGTADPDGLAEVRRLVNVVRTRRPELPVQLCWLERAAPLLPEALASLAGPVVVVPLLLSTGYHVKTDIAVAVAGRPRTAVARQLGPDRRITQVVYERLAAGREPEQADVVLFSAGSSDPEAFEQLVAVAEQLEGMIRQAENSDRTRVYPSYLSTEDGWATDLPEDPDVANYLLAPGRFNDLLRRQAATGLNARSVAHPIGAHPLVARVICDRYDEAAGTLATDPG